jgi:hypothetical protein
MSQDRMFTVSENTPARAGDIHARRGSHEPSNQALVRLPAVPAIHVNQDSGVHKGRGSGLRTSRVAKPGLCLTTVDG